MEQANLQTTKQKTKRLSFSNSKYRDRKTDADGKIDGSRHRIKG